MSNIFNLEQPKPRQVNLCILGVWLSLHSPIILERPANDFVEGKVP